MMKILVNASNTFDGNKIYLLAQVVFKRKG